MNPSRVRLVAHEHRNAGPLTAALARTSRVTPGLSAELLDYLNAVPLAVRDEVATLWEYVERTGPDGARSLRTLDAERRARFETNVARVAS